MPEAPGADKVKIGDCSRLGQVARLDAPVNRETFFNAGARNGRPASMQLKSDTLERIIGEPHTNHIAKTACPAGKVC